MGRSKLKNKYLELSSRKNLLVFKYSKQKCASLKKAPEGNTANSKKFWKSVSPFLTNKNLKKNDNFITLQEAKKL